MKKHTFYSEFAYVIGLFLLAFGTAMTAADNFGISMVVAPAFVLQLKLSQSVSWFTFGFAEYVLQVFILLAMMLILRRVKLTYFFSFLTAILYGLLLDASTLVVALFAPTALWQRIAIYVTGHLLICAGVAFFFHTYLTPKSYELFVIEISAKLHIKVHIFKTLYDCGSLLVAVLLSFALFGQLRGIGVGTIVCAFVCGSVIKGFDLLINRIWVFRDRFTLRPLFEESEVKS